MHARITAYKGQLVIELLTQHSIPGEVAVNECLRGDYGQLIMNTEKNLGVSQEAFAILQTLKPGSGGLPADMIWFDVQENQAFSQTFGWLGGANAIVDPEWTELDPNWQLGKYVSIPNTVPDGAKEAIDAEDDQC